MYILLLSRGIPTKQEPQLGCFEKDQAEALAAYGHRVVVASIDGRMRLIYRKIGITKLHKNNVVYYNSFIAPTYFLNNNQKLKFLKWQFRHLYKRIVKEEGKPDIICGHFSGTTYYAVDLARSEHIPIVGIEHNAVFNEPKLSPPTDFSSHYAYAKTDAIIAVSKNLQERLKHHLNVESTVVNNLVGTEFFNSAVSKDNPSTFKLIAVGTLEYRKGYDILIKACAKLKHIEQWSLIIVGEGSIRHDLEKLIMQYGLQDNIKLVGMQVKSAISEFLCSSSAFVMPSRNENFSVALLEALACGLPVIATDCGGAQDCLNKRNGIIVPIEDVDALADAIQIMMREVNHFDRQWIAQDCRSRFSPSAIAEQLTNIFQQTINNYYIV